MKIVSALLLLGFGIAFARMPEPASAVIGWSFLGCGSLLLLPRFERLDMKDSSRPIMQTVRVAWIAAGSLVALFGAGCVAIVVQNLRKGDRLGAAVFVLIAAAMLRGASELALPAARSRLFHARR